MPSILNGQIPAEYMAPVPGQSGLRLTPVAAASWGQVRVEVQRRYGWTPTLTDAYRDLHGHYGQIQTFLRRYQRAWVQFAAGRVDQRFYLGVPYYRKPGTAAAAVPGTSNHGFGVAGDVANLGGFGSTRFRQFADVATEYGWSNEEGRSVGEPWHWVKAGARLTDNATTTTPTTVATPAAPVAAPKPITPIDTEDEDMNEKIHAIYRRILGRDPDPAGLALNGYMIATGQLTYAQLAENLKGSGEAWSQEARDRRIAIFGAGNPNF